MAMMVYIALGSNIGDRRSHLEEALSMMQDSGQILCRISDFFVTEAQTPVKQPYYVNAVAAFQTDLLLQDFFELTCVVESKMGRTAKGDYQARVIDLDILFFGEEYVESENLCVPHPKLQDRDFVLLPLWQIASALIHPRLNESIEVIYNRKIWGVY